MGGPGGCEAVRLWGGEAEAVRTASTTVPGRAAVAPSITNLSRSICVQTATTTCLGDVNEEASWSATGSRGACKGRCRMGATMRQKASRSKMREKAASFVLSGARAKRVNMSFEHGSRGEAPLERILEDRCPRVTTPTTPSESSTTGSWSIPYARITLTASAIAIVGGTVMGEGRSRSTAVLSAHHSRCAPGGRFTSRPPPTWSSMSPRRADGRLRSEAGSMPCSTIQLSSMNLDM